MEDKGKELANFACPLTGKIAIVTAGGAGQGRAHCQALAARGAHVFVQDIIESRVEETVKLVRGAGYEASPLPGDVTDLRAFRSDLQHIELETGKIDILVNNAGMSGRRMRVEDVDEETFDRMIALTIKQTFFAGQTVIPGMKARSYGKIINISSNFALKGSPSASHYTAAKSAILGLTKAWARELAPWQICVNAIAPSLIKTEMTLLSNGEEWIDSQVSTVPMGRLGLPEDIASTVVFLASPDSDFMTGQTLSPNGGDTIVGI